MRPLYVSGAWVVSVGGEPIREGAVLVRSDGRIAWHGPAAVHPPPEEARVFAFPRGVVAPGLVNVHTHVELTHLEGLATARAFDRWIGQVRRLKEATAPEEFEAAARLGLVTMWAQGVTTVADTGSSGAAVHALAELGGRGTAFHEVFGPDPEQAPVVLRDLSAVLDTLIPHCSARVRLGVSPHTAYTASGPLIAGACELAERRGLPLAMHVAESPAETAFVREGSGPFAEAHWARGIPVAPRARSPVAWLEALGVLERRPLCIHAVQTDADDVELLATRGAPVAHCPLSNAAHGHGSAPLASWRRAGLAVGLGTDSVASRTPLDLRAEGRATGLAWRDQIELLTVGGARALGMAGAIGTLAAGAWGDVAVFEDEHQRDPWEVAAVGRVRLTAVGGRVVWDGASWPGVDSEPWRSVVAQARRRLAATAEAPATSR